MEDFALTAIVADMYTPRGSNVPALRLCVVHATMGDEHMPRFGMVTFSTEYSMQPAELARAIEDHGLDEICVVPSAGRVRALPVIDGFAEFVEKSR